MGNDRFIGYVGTYTKKESKGVYRFELDVHNKKLEQVTVAAELSNPTYVTVSKDNKNLYAVAKMGEEGGVASFSIDENGQLAKINEQSLQGSPPCHIEVNEANSVLVTANYHSTLGVLHTINSEGSVKIVDTAQHEGNGPHERQEKPHLHYAGFTPDEKYVVIVDLGTDTITSYAYESGTLEKKYVFHTKEGSGPRHITFHPNGQYAFVMTELSNEVIVLKYDGNGQFEEVQSISTLPGDFTDNSQGSAIHISSDGKFVYAGNRGHDSIAIFKVTDKCTLEFVEWTHTEGQWPRDFVLDPTENFLVASNQESNNLTLFERDKGTGKLTLIEKDIYAPEPVCVKFLK
ncbi:lactonase family protein [Gracilibacillus marinus]|jgi:6-phosphogluconolactonase|uniref:Lactonase family protein n=1 Tax=Gracilibacillus marinus TaxID=630535 RepID=A0ABV8VWS5_9BACI